LVEELEVVGVHFFLYHLALDISERFTSDLPSFVTFPSDLIFEVLIYKKVVTRYWWRCYTIKLFVLLQRQDELSLHSLLIDYCVVLFDLNSTSAEAFIYYEGKLGGNGIAFNPFFRKYMEIHSAWQ
jgi:hypothetical protein